MKLHPIAIALGMTMAAGAVAQEEQLPTVEVKANASDVDKIVEVDGQRVSAVEGAQVITSDYIRAQQATTLADALRKTTSIQIDEEGGPQSSLIYVRGFSQDQISVRVEGAPKNFNLVRHGGAGSTWLEPDMYKSVSVIPGVASNVYGNGSLGGVVMFETKDPEDIAGDKDWGLTLRGGIETNGESQYVSVDGAKIINDQWAVSTTIIARDTDPYEDGEGRETLEGSTGTQDVNGLFKAVFTPTDEQRVEASYQRLEKDYTARTTTGSGAYSAPSDTELTDETYSLMYAFNPEDNDWLNLKARVSQTSTERWRLTEGDTDPSIWGVETTYAELENITTLIQSDDVLHQIRFGIDYTYDDVLTAYTNASGLPIERERTQLGGYISDTVYIGETLELVGSLRFDNFENTNEGTSINESAVSPKINVNWSPFEETAAKGLSFYGVVGSGFRSPAVHEAFGRGDPAPVCGRRSCSMLEPNESLKGESSDSWEAGFKYNRTALFTSSDQLSFQVGYIKNDVEDMISQQEIGQTEFDVDGDGSDDTVQINQFQNIDHAEIDGIEVSFNYTSDFLFAVVSAQNLDGTDSTGAKLADIAPASLNATLGTYLFDGKSRVGIDMTSRQDRRYVQRNVERYREDYRIFDVFASYQFSDNLLLQLRVANLFDELYAKRAITTNTDGEDVTTYQPGRNIKLTAEYKF